MIKAAITPGTHPQSVRIKTITIEPHPLSITAKGGSKIAKSTRMQPIVILLIFSSRSSEKIMNLKNKPLGFVVSKSSFIGIALNQVKLRFIEVIG